MDKLGMLHQFLPPAIKPLNPEMVVIGRAAVISGPFRAERSSMPVLSVDVFSERIFGSANKLMEKPFGLMLEAWTI